LLVAPPVGDAVSLLVILTSVASDLLLLPDSAVSIDSVFNQSGSTTPVVNNLNSSANPFLGINVKIDRGAKTVTLSHETYFRKFLAMCSAWGVSQHSVSIPIKTGARVTKSQMPAAGAAHTDEKLKEMQTSYPLNPWCTRAYQQLNSI
jgi:hypothetical protein